MGEERFIEQQYRGVWYRYYPTTGEYRYNIEGVSYVSTSYAQMTQHIDGVLAPPPIEVTPEYPSPDEIIITYRGYDIWYSPYHQYYFVKTYGFETTFPNVAEAKLWIDQMLAIEPPTEQPPIEGGGEQPPTPPQLTPVTVPMGIPWPMTWMEGVLKWLGDVWQITVNAFTVAINAFLGRFDEIKIVTQDGNKNALDHYNKQDTNMKGIGSFIWGGLIDNLQSMFSRASEESLNKVTQSLPDITGHSSPEKKAMDAQLNVMANEYVTKTFNVLDPANYTHSTLSPEEAKNQLTVLGTAIAGVNIGIWAAHFFTEAITLGQVEAVAELGKLVINNLGVNSISSEALMIPLKKSIMQPAEYYYNSVYTPNIPNYSDLINMLVKEKITQEEFNTNFAYLGYNEEWSKRIWDAHFQAPTLTDIVTAWRRGLITEAEVDRLMILVDLDPAYKQIFDVRKYNDPSMTMARMMYETGSITLDQVREIVHREGYDPIYEDNIVKYIQTFQERLWRRRYLVSLSTAITYKAITEADFTKEVVDAGFTQAVAEWMIKNAQVRNRIVEARTTGQKVKLLNLSDLRDSFSRNYITEDNFRTELMLRGYDVGDIDLMVRLLEADKVTVERGGSKVALSQAELLNAFKFGEITEDALRTELMLRGLNLDEVTMLINTKKKQWGIGEVQG